MFDNASSQVWFPPEGYLVEAPSEYQGGFRLNEGRGLMG